jgi:RimJ/RimL family protein N-acetyltransferase
MELPEAGSVALGCGGVPRINEFGQPVGDPVAWSEATPPAPVTLSGRFVDLRPLTVEHAQGILDSLGPHTQLWTYQFEEPPADVDEVARAIVARGTSTDSLAFVILDPQTREVRGRVSYLRIQPGLGSIEVGSIIYAPSLQRTKAATEAQYLLMRHAFDALGFRRYEWKCDSLNQPSRDAALRLGFTYEGTWRNALVTKGRNRDTSWYSITDAEWPLVKHAFETWLADDNFDEYGAQRQSLASIRILLSSSA